MFRGLDDTFYYALRDESAVSDALTRIKYIVEKEYLIAKTDVITYPGTGEILALELDPLNSNDIDSRQLYEASANKEKGKDDRLYLIDGQLNLFKLVIEEREGSKVLSKKTLTVHSNIERAMESLLRDKSFTRISVADRCITIRGRTFNFDTGFDWDFLF